MKLKDWMEEAPCRALLALFPGSHDPRLKTLVLMYKLLKLHDRFFYFLSLIFTFLLHCNI